MSEPLLTRPLFVNGLSRLLYAALTALLLWMERRLLAFATRTHAAACLANGRAMRD